MRGGEEARLRSYLEKATRDLRAAKRRVQDLQDRAQEPIAIVGMSCRFPGGVSSPGELWKLVAAGADAISACPPGRGWDLARIYDPDPDRPGASCVAEGGFLHDAAEFDADFFGIGPFEAQLMDPQQRLLLEGCWEALEDAGIDPRALRGAPVSVFAGVMYHEYGWGLDHESVGLGGHVPTVGSGSVVSGRVAYAFGLEGPAISVDTACSSSLVALHLAVQALRAGECSLALAGGVSVFSTPRAFVESTRQRVLAPDGRCKSFAAAADGVGFAEGIGVLAVERLSQAQERGHPVLAVVRGSAVNQDGASNGLTAPSGPAQERVIREALRSAGLTPQDIELVEAHGTGTTLGDTIEAGALLATYGQGRERPLQLGSVKSNIGHPQAAAGVAGVIKTVMAMREGTMPKTLHVDRPTANVDWERGEIELLTEALAWEPEGRPRRAAVSSFGASGTNAHVILEQAPSVAADRARGERQSGGGAADADRSSVGEVERRAGGRLEFAGRLPFVLSGKSWPALREAARRLAAHLGEHPDLEPGDVAYSLALGRSAFEHRAVVIAAPDGELPKRLEADGHLRKRLEALADGVDASDLVCGRARSAFSPAFVFSGHGSQWPSMAIGLLEDSAAFASHMAACEEALEPFIDFSPRDVLHGDDRGWLERVDLVQPILFAVTVSLARLWEHHGVVPDAVAGHSQGEVAAAHIAGGLSLADAARVAALRSRIIARMAGRGGLISVALPARSLEARLQEWQGRVETAAINGPAWSILSGDEDALEQIIATWGAEGVRVRRILGSLPSHSAHVEEFRDEVLTQLAPLCPRSGDVPFFSTVSGGRLDTAELDASYWYRNLRQPVLMEPVLRALIDGGRRVLIEVSPHPVLVPAMQETVESAGYAPGEVPVLGTLRRNEGDAERFLLSLAEAFVVGVRVDWGVAFAGRDAAMVKLPTYPFERRRFWLTPARGSGDMDAVGLQGAGHPLLGAVLEDPRGGLTLSGRIGIDTHPWLVDHASAGTVLLPGTAFVEIALRAGSEAGCERLVELTLQAPLILSERDAVQVQVTVGEPGERGERSLSIHSRPRPRAGEQDGQWSCHAHGILSPEPAEPAEPLGAWPPEGAQPLQVEGLYERLAAAGFEYGPAFQNVVAAWQCGEEIFAELTLAEEQALEAARYGVHPALLDAVAHAAIDVGLAGAEQGAPVLPFAWRGVCFGRTGVASLRVRLRPGAGEMESGFLAYDERGELVASVSSVAARPVDPAQLRAAAQRRSLYCLRWPEVELAAGPGGSAPEVLAVDGSALEVLELLAQPGEDAALAARRLAGEALAAVQGWLASEPGLEDRFAVVTHGGVWASEGDSPDPALAAVWGLVRSAASEHPGRFCLVDVDSSEASAQALPVVLAQRAEPQVALREGACLVPRLARADPEPEQSVAVFDPRATVLVTGGTSGIGALIARHLVECHRVSHLLLVSRRGLDAPGAGELARELEELGAEVTVAACDVSDRDQLCELLASIDGEHPLGAVIHSAAVLDDGVIESLDAGRLRRVMAPKTDAAWHLHELTREMKLSHFLLCSSAAGLLGGAAQANYAAANSFLDALAARRHAEGLPATSLAWGLWWQQSSAVDWNLDPEQLEQVAQQIRMRLGFAPMAPSHGVELFDAACSRGEALLAPALLDASVLLGQAKIGALPAMLRGIVRLPAGRTGDAQAGSLALQLASVPEPERRAHVLQLVRTHVASILGHASASAVDPERAFSELGFDSLAAVELRNKLAAATGLQLPSTLAFDYPSAKVLAEHLLAQATASGIDKAPALRAQASDEPIAIVGIACRYPGGVSSPAELWQLVAEGREAAIELPSDRGWDLARLYHPDPDHRGTFYARGGAFLDDATGFDRAFFGIGPDEATAIDPQQRLMLEASWEALEDAGIDPQRLRGTPTGVFAGVMYQDYGSIEFGVAPGMSAGAVSGRVAYTFGLEGPTMSVDTACSSSLVTLHLACQALRQGECTMALAGGVTVLSTPGMLVLFSGQRGLAPDGRCKPFAEAADGVGLAEGVGVLVLERLSDARRNGHTVLATIRGSAVNQDGASNGLTAPNGPSQERVIRQALANARLAPGDVDVVEAHGTGTTLGDPIEAGALLATYGQGRERPLYLGSVKSNIGHTQAAAGVAGVIKMVMALREGALPRTLHAGSPSTKIDWQSGAIELLSDPQPWSRNGRPRRAAVSSFGGSGTNAHVILEEAPAPELQGPQPQGHKPQGREPLGRDGSQHGGQSDDQDSAGPVAGALSDTFLLPVSAKTPKALREQASRLLARIDEDPELSPADLSFSLAGTRSAFKCRAVAVGADRPQLVKGLEALASETECASLVRGVTRGEHAPVFLFGGQGAQHASMAVGLLEASRGFAERIDACERALSQYVDWSLTEVLRDVESRWLGQLEIVQPVLFAVMVSLAGLWQELGVQPAAVVGHSQGEIAAVHVAGGLSLADAALVAVRRSQAIAKLAGKGAMLSVSLPADQLASRLEPFGARLSVAAINGPASVVVSGEADAIGKLLASCEQEGVRAQRVAVDYAAHSAQIDALEGELLDAFASISPRSSQVAVYSTVAGAPIDTAEMDARYWYRNLRETVLMEPVLRALLEQGRHAFIEATPHPVLGFLVREAIEQALPDPQEAVVIESLRRGEKDAERFALSLATAHAHGIEIDWRALLLGTDAKRVALPTYPFQRRRHWLAPTRDAGAMGGDRVSDEQISATLAARLALLPESGREPAVLELVCGHAAEVLGHDSSAEVDPDRPFKELGFDSIGAVELRDRLVAATGLKLAPTVIFDHPTSGALARFICARACGAPQEALTAGAAMGTPSTGMSVSGTIPTGAFVAHTSTAGTAAAQEPIAIVGMGCRYPGGASTPDLLWRLLADGRDCISAFPADRIPGLAAFGAAGRDRDQPCNGGFLESIADFDAGFFGVAPRDATAIDPQQRLMLEVAWEALEGAGVDPHSLRGSQAGVFVGAASGDYGMLLASTEPSAIGSVIYGTSASVVAGRVSYTLGLEGPSIAVDTACSSSLVAIHLALHSLHGGECSLALAGGAMVIVTPAGMSDLEASGALAPDGRCKSFAEAADGTGFSEGLGMIVLERLSDARRLGHRVLATVRGSAINQDGASNGLAAPNGLAQERVIRQALANAGLAARDVDAVEAHGTGTMLGDPIEAGALLATYGQDRVEPLWLGSIKSNIGHTATAAGVAGVIKMVMALREGALPKTLHADRRSSKIDWGSGKVELLTEQVPWQANGRPRRAGVSSFGMSGTNAHLILEEAPPQVREEVPEIRDETSPQIGEGAPPRLGEGAPRDATPPQGMALAGVVPLAISAKTDAALREMAGRLHDHLQAHPELDLASVGRTLTTARARFARRGVVLGVDRDVSLDALDAIAGGKAHRDVVRGDARAIRGTAFIFAGYGSQWPGMALELRQSVPKFAAAMRECEEALEPHLDWSLDDVLRGVEGSPALDRGDVCSIALFATAVSLARLWQACGVQPSVLAGHSQGELVAAHIAGGLSLRDAAMIAASRVRMLRKLEGKGAMASVALAAGELVTRLARWDQRIEIAAMNGPNASVVSGEGAALEELLAECARDGVKAKMIPGSVASHSRQVEELRDEFIECFASVSPRSGQIPFHSTVTGGLLDTAHLDAEYWYRNARQTVLLEPVVRRLVEGGAHALLEVGPHPILAAGLRETLDTVDGAGRIAILGTLRRQEGDAPRFARALAEAYVAGVFVDWSSYFGGAATEAVELPTYPFQRQRYWPRATAATAGDVTAAGLSDAAHPLLAAATETPDGGWLFSGRVSRTGHPWLADYALLDSPGLPAAALAELALSAASKIGVAGVRELSLEAPMALSEESAVQLQLSVGPAAESGERSVAIHSRQLGSAEQDGAAGEWVCHARGSLLGGELQAGAPTAQASAEWPPPDAEQLDLESLHDRLLDGGVHYGPLMQGVRAAWRHGRDLYLEASLPQELEDGRAARFQMHPVLLDCAALIAVNASLLDGKATIAPSSLQLPALWRQIAIWAPGASAMRMTISADGDSLAISATDLDGRLVLEIGALCGRAIEGVQSQRARRRRLHRMEWSALSLPAVAATKPRLALICEQALPGLDAERHPDVVSLLRAMESGARPDAVIAIPPAAPQGDVPDGVRATSCWGLETLQRWIASDASQGARLTLLSTRAVAIGDSEEPDLLQAPLWGMTRSAQSEHPGRFALVDIDDLACAPEVLQAALEAGEHEPQLAIREGALLAPRLRRLGEIETAARPLDPERTVLITGGVSGAGAAVARHLVAHHGAGHLLLVSRRGRDAEGAAELEEELAQLGAVVSVAACDVADRAQLEGLLASVDPEHPLGAVIHSAAVLDNGVLELQTPERLELVMRPKVDGAWHLHDLTKDLDLDQFLLFSSAAAVAGTAAQTNYAAANSFLDQLATYRRRRGLPGTSLAWGGWLQQSTLFGEVREADLARLARLGIGALMPEQALELFDAARQTGEAQLVPVAIQSAALRAQEAAGMLPPILSALVPARRAQAQADRSLPERVAGLSGSQREAVALSLVREQIATVLGFSSVAEIDQDRALQEMGFDSLGVVELRNHIASASGLQMPMLALTNQPTPLGIARALLAQLCSETDASAGEARALAGEAPATALVSMLDRACEDGKVEDFLGVLSAAAKLRPVFDGAEALAMAPQAVRLRERADSPCLVFASSLGPLSGTHEYVRLARELSEDWSVLALPMPGFAAGELLPASLQALVRAQAASISAARVGDVFVLGGHSSGGWVAHALAAHLCAEGKPPAAVVLIDTYHPRSPALAKLVPSVLMAAHEAGTDGPATDDARLTAMAAYSELFAQWQPSRLPVPSIVLRASAAQSDGSAGLTYISGAAMEGGVDVPGDHFSMVNEHAASTAKAIEESIELTPADAMATDLGGYR